MRTVTFDVYAEILQEWQPGWCDTCLLPSAFTCRLAVWIDRGETSVMDLTCCPECGERMDSP